MPTYVTLYKLTQQGVEGLKDLPDGIDEVCGLYESMGGKIIGIYALMGSEYDFVAIGEAPDEDMQLTFALRLVSRGNATSQTIRAFSYGMKKTWIFLEPDD